MGYSYRDCLSEEIEILRLMLFRHEFVEDPYACQHCEPLFDKRKFDINELSDLDALLAA